MLYQESVKVIKITGSDALGFVENLTTQSLIQQSSQELVGFHCILDTKGKILFTFSVIPLSETSFYLITDNEDTGDLFEHFDRMIFAEDVVLDEEVLHLQVVEGEFLFDHDPNIVAYESWKILVHPSLDSRDVIASWYSRYTGSPGVTLLTKKLFTSSEILSAFGVNDPEGNQVVEETVFTYQRILAGYPTNRYLKGLLFNHVGLFDSFLNESKGCYPGQEIVTRINQRGVVTKQLGLRQVQSDELAEINATQTLSVNNLHFEVNSFKKSEQGIEFCPLFKSESFNKAAHNYYLQGLDKFHQGDFENSENELKKSLDFYPENPDVWEALGVSYERRNMLDKAIQTHKQFARLSPKSIMAHANLSRLYMLKGWIEKAEDEQNIAREIHFEESAKANSSDVRALEEAQNQLNAEKEARKQMFEKVLGIDPEDDIALFGLGKFYQDKKDSKKALEYLEKLLEIKSDYAAAYPIIVKAYIALENWNSALKYLKAGQEVCQSQGAMVPLKQLDLQLKKIPN